MVYFTFFLAFLPFGPLTAHWCVCHRGRGEPPAVHELFLTLDWLSINSWLVKQELIVGSYSHSDYHAGKINLLSNKKESGPALHAPLLCVWITLNCHMSSVTLQTRFLRLCVFIAAFTFKSTENMYTLQGFLFFMSSVAAMQNLEAMHFSCFAAGGSGLILSDVCLLNTLCGTSGMPTLCYKTYRHKHTLLYCVDGSLWTGVMTKTLHSMQRYGPHCSH